MLLCDNTFVPVSDPPSICVRMRPSPPVTNGRTPAPCVPPIGTPTITLPIKSSTLLLPKSSFVPKKLGLQPKPSSPPITPAPMPPAFTPKPARPLSKLLQLLPAFADTHGLTYPSARATAGAETMANVATTIRAFSTHRMIFLLLQVAGTRDDRPGNSLRAEESASVVPLMISSRLVQLRSVEVIAFGACSTRRSQARRT